MWPGPGRFAIGDCQIEVLHTPGHTSNPPVSAEDESGKDHCLFTGDTLFVGDVGRPDWLKSTNEPTTTDLADYYMTAPAEKIMPPTR